ncbi:MAG: hypothetical protein ACKVWV_02655 [Planctomycetota bacterium]
MHTTTEKLVATLLLLVGLAAPLQAAEHIKLKNGTVLSGRATAYDSQKKSLTFRTDSGEVQNYTLDQLDEQSVYYVNASLVAKDSGKGQLQLANLARDIGLYAHAARRYGYAEKADPTLKSQVEQERVLLRSQAADYCMKNARDAVGKNDIKGAEKWLTLLIEKLPNEPQADEAAALLEKHYAKERDARDDALERDLSAQLEQDLKKGKQHYDRMITRTKDGLTAKNSGKSASLWKSAIDDGQVVLKELDRLAKKYPSDPKVQDGVPKYRKLTIDQMVDAHLHLASNYTIKSSLNKALEETNAALALDPENAQAVAQRARIEQAASEGFDLF